MGKWDELPDERRAKVRDALATIVGEYEAQAKQAERFRRTGLAMDIRAEAGDIKALIEHLAVTP